MAWKGLTIIALSTAFSALLPAARADAETVIVTDRQCDAYQPYQPDPSVEYKPGEDVHGRPVAPADLGGGLEVSPDINIPITVDIRPWQNRPRSNTRQTQNRRNRPSPSYRAPGIDGRASIGTVSVHNGKVYFNGQPMEAAYQNAVRQACFDYLKRKRADRR